MSRKSKKDPVKSVKKQVVRSSIAGLIDIGDLVRQVQEAEANDLDDIPSTSKDTASQANKTTRESVQISDDYRGRDIFDASKTWCLFNPEELCLSRFCQNNDGYNDQRSPEEVRTALLKGEFRTNIHTVDSLPCISQYLFYTVASTDDHGVLFPANIAFEHLVTMKANFWAPTPSDVLAVLVNLGAPSEVLANIPGVPVVTPVKLPYWLTSSRGTSSQPVIADNNGHASVGRNFSENLIKVVKIVGCSAQRHQNYSSEDCVQLAHMLLKLACAKGYCHKATLHSTILHTVSVLLDLIDEESWIYKECQLVEDFSKSLWELGKIDPHEVLFICQMLSSCGMRGLQLCLCLSYLVIQDFLGNSFLQVNARPELTTLSDHVRNNVRDIYQNPEPYKVWVSVQLMSHFVANEPLSAEEWVALNKLRKWMIQESSKLRDTLDKPYITKIKDQMFSLSTLWEVFLNNDVMRQPTIARFLTK